MPVTLTRALGLCLGVDTCLKRGTEEPGPQALEGWCCPAS